MGRLIDAENVKLMLSELLEVAQKENFTAEDAIDHATVWIDNLPTAFDADMVYRQMWREAEEVCGNTMIDLEVADEIIRNGGKE